MDDQQLDCGWRRDAIIFAEAGRMMSGTRFTGTGLGSESWNLLGIRYKTWRKEERFRRVRETLK